MMASRPSYLASVKPINSRISDKYYLPSGVTGDLEEPGTCYQFVNVDVEAVISE